MTPSQGYEAKFWRSKRNGKHASITPDRNVARSTCVVPVRCNHAPLSLNLCVSERPLRVPEHAGAISGISLLPQLQAVSIGRRAMSHTIGDAYSRCHAVGFMATKIFAGVSWCAACKPLCEAFQVRDRRAHADTRATAERVALTAVCFDFGMCIA